MIEMCTGDLFESGAQALVNPVNCAGVMGAGAAVEFKRRYPEMFRAYAIACRDKLLRPGKVWVWSLPDEKYVVNFPTKDHWRNRARLEWIRDGLDDLGQWIADRRIQSVAVSALGCGRGGLSFAPVRELIDQKLGGLGEVRVMVYPPQ